MSFIEIHLSEIRLRGIRIIAPPSEGKIFLVLEKIKKVCCKYWNLKVKQTVIDYSRFQMGKVGVVIAKITA